MESAQVAEPGADLVIADLAIECLAQSGTLRLRVAGVSMLPQISPRSYVRIRSIAPQNATPGDIILTRTSVGVRLHRLIEIEGTGDEAVFVTRGDNNDDLDPPVPAHAVLGILTDVELPSRLSRLLSLL